MSIADRLQILERACGVNQCPACGAPDVQPVIIDATDDAQPDARPDVLTCVLCGSTPREIRIVDSEATACA